MTYETPAPNPTTIPYTDDQLLRCIASIRRDYLINGLENNFVAILMHLQLGVTLERAWEAILLDRLRPTDEDLK